MSEMKYTQKSIEAMSGAQSLATEHSNQQLEQAHLLCALLNDEKGLIPQMLRKMGKDVGQVTADAEALVDKCPGCTGYRLSRGSSMCPRT